MSDHMLAAEVAWMQAKADLLAWIPIPPDMNSGAIWDRYVDAYREHPDARADEIVVLIHCPGLPPVTYFAGVRAFHGPDLEPGQWQVTYLPRPQTGIDVV